MALTDDEIEARLSAAIEARTEDLLRHMDADSHWYGIDPNPFDMQDTNGRSILLDAYSSLALFRAARIFKSTMEKES